MDWDRVSIAWAAALFEGEGCIRATNATALPGRKYQHLSLAMTDLDVVDRFHEIVGPGRRSVIHQERRKPMYRWECGKFEDVQAIIAAFWPFLGLRRRAKAMEVLGQRKAQPARRIATQEHCAQGHPWTDDTFKIRGGFPSCRICERDVTRRQRMKRGEIPTTLF